MSIHPHPLMDRSRTPGQETRPTRDNGPKPDAGSGDPAYKGSSSGETRGAAGSGRSEPWRRTNPSPRAAARELILPRASSASAGTVPRSAPTTTPTHPHPLMDRSRTPGQETRPTRDNGSKQAAGSGDPAYKGSSSGETPAAAGSGRSEPWRRTNPIPRAAARKLILPRASSASVGPVPRSAPNTPSGAGSVQSEPWRRTPKIPRAQRESSSSPEPPQRAQD
jgi:hypothetical protein